MRLARCPARSMLSYVLLVVCSLTACDFEESPPSDTTTVTDDSCLADGCGELDGDVLDHDQGEWSDPNELPQDSLPSTTDTLDDDIGGDEAYPTIECSGVQCPLGSLCDTNGCTPSLASLYLHPYSKDELISIDVVAFGPQGGILALERHTFVTILDDSSINPWEVCDYYYCEDHDIHNFLVLHSSEGEELWRHEITHCSEYWASLALTDDRIYAGLTCEHQSSYEDGTPLDIGICELPAFSGQDVFLLTLSMDGEVESITHLATEGDDRINDIAPEPSGAVQLTVSLGDEVLYVDGVVQDPDATWYKPSLHSKLDATGEVVWAKRSGGTHGSLHASVVLEDDEGAAFIAGGLIEPFLLLDDVEVLNAHFLDGAAVLYHADSNGIATWGQAIGAEWSVRIQSIASRGSQGVVLDLALPYQVTSLHIGTTWYPLDMPAKEIVVAFDGAGAVQWLTPLPCGQENSTMTVGVGGEIFIVHCNCTYETPPPGTPWEMMSYAPHSLTKLDAGGAFVWSVPLDGFSYDIPVDLYVLEGGEKLEMLVKRLDPVITIGMESYSMENAAWLIALFSIATDSVGP